ncbi:hypothetical protein F5X98DRAFT_66844 [Xylaria grammica]|nr:hypothetical protein F5X98DRAFT_66844 [Xylaria grammica]
MERIKALMLSLPLGANQLPLELPVVVKDTDRGAAYIMYPVATGCVVFPAYTPASGLVRKLTSGTDTLVRWIQLELDILIGGLWRRRSSGGACRNIWSRACMGRGNLCSVQCTCTVLVLGWPVYVCMYVVASPYCLVRALGTAGSSPTVDVSSVASVLFTFFAGLV